MRETPEDEPLAGGGSTHVVRHGDVVLRERRPWSPTVIGLLRHLHDEGLGRVPQPAGDGFAADGREQLEYIHASSAPQVWSEAGCYQLGVLLVLWMLTIAFLPFPTALVAKAGHQPATKVLYIGTIALSTVATGLVSWVMRRNPQITDGEGKPDAERGVVSAVLLLLALVITLAIPATSYFPLLLLFLETPVRQLMRMVRRKA